jgi:uncharacterized protein YndB with AHSA1/START domain
MRKGDATHVVVGEYKEIRPPEKLVFTWRWETKPMNDTIVTIELLDRGHSTELVLTHEKLSPVEFRDEHGHGWTGRLEMLAGYISERSAR